MLDLNDRPEVAELKQQLVDRGKKMRGMECHVARLVHRGYQLDIPVTEMAEWIGCSTRKVRYLMLVQEAIEEGSVTEQDVINHGWTKIAKLQELWNRTGIYKFGEVGVMEKAVVNLATPDSEPVINLVLRLTPEQHDIINEALASFGSIQRGKRFFQREPAMVAMAKFVLAKAKGKAA